MVFVDFDDTLCLHRKEIDSKNFICEGNAYLSSVPNKPLIDKLYALKQEGHKIVLLTMASAFMLKHKIEWCEKNCPDLINDYEGLSIDCSKKDYISQISNSVSNNEVILFIDDSHVERHQVEELDKVIVYSPQLFVIEGE